MLPEKYYLEQASAEHLNYLFRVCYAATGNKLLLFRFTIKGYIQTMFTRHAPFVSNCIKAFDEDLEYLKKQGTSCSSREYAIQTIKKIVDELKKELNNDKEKK